MSSMDTGAQGLGSPQDIIRQMLQMSTVYRSAEQDPQDLLAMEKASTILQQILASYDKDQSQLMGGQNQRALSRAAAGLGGGGY